MSSSPSHREALRRIRLAGNVAEIAGGARQIPWHDPEFSRRMLKVHLDPTTHMASRQPAVIRAHVDWLEALLTGRTGGHGVADAPARILDVGCGPGLYCHELERRGIHAVGFDFAPAPLEWARETAAARNLDCDFIEADLTALSDDFAARTGPCDAVTFWFGEFNSSTGEQAAAFLPRLAECLVPGGLFILEYQPYDLFVRENSNRWSCPESSVFCDGPHLWLQQFTWNEETRTETHVHWILPEDSGILQRYVQCHQAWSDEELIAMLATAGFVDPVFYPPVTGAAEEFEFPLLVTRRTERTS